ncbi:DUF3592 domain-containing protein [Burkholderia anthina]|uniref:DUF3592 domain-containing protein n=1 Tax=Burkholderia anthina TaxID=179879 RepID=UPI001589A4DA|nr:DUF3592 domain-containing protein [Burkholderia anthina]MBY4867016.1 DUF3592 domain-containing protein [Burkholderia anthina]
MKRTNPFQAFLFLIAGGIFLVAMILTYQDTSDFLQSSSVANGKVTELNHGSSHPEIEFTTQSGEKISYPQGGFIFGMSVGDEVSVRYLADAPRRTARLDQFGSMWFWTLATAMFAIVFLAIGIVSLRQALMGRQKEEQ